MCRGGPCRRQTGRWRCNGQSGNGYLWGWPRRHCSHGDPSALRLSVEGLHACLGKAVRAIRTKLIENIRPDCPHSLASVKTLHWRVLTEDPRRLVGVPSGDKIILSWFLVTVHNNRVQYQNQYSTKQQSNEYVCSLWYNSCTAVFYLLCFINFMTECSTVLN